MPRQPADDEEREEAEREQHRRVEVQVPAPEVASQLKIFIPVGTAMIIEAIMKKACSEIGRPTVNMWWRPDQHREEADSDRRGDDRLVPEHGLAREDRQHLRDDPEGRQDDDVHLGARRTRTRAGRARPNRRPPG